MFNAMHWNSEWWVEKKKKKKARKVSKPSTWNRKNYFINKERAREQMTFHFEDTNALEECNHPCATSFQGDLVGCWDFVGKLLKLRRSLFHHLL